MGREDERVQARAGRLKKKAAERANQERDGTTFLALPHQVLNSHAEAGADWPRRDNHNEVRERPGCACRSGSARARG